MDQPPTLAIETSQRTGGVALSGGAGRIDVELLADRKRHDDDLMPAIDRLCTRAHIAPQDLAAVGVSIGPGGFTGLRIAVSTVKMLAAALGVSVVAVPSTLVVAESAPDDAFGDGPIMVALASKRESFWGTRLVRGAGGWSIADADGANGALREASAFALDGIAALVGDRYLPDAARQRCEDAAIPVIEPRFDPRACLEITLRMLAAGAVTDPHVLAPIYARPPEAVRLWEGRSPVQ